MDVYKALGWNDENAIRADIAAGHGQEKLNAYLGSSGGGGGGGGFPNIPAFKFDYDLAEKEALAKLEPYYRQKLKENEGDVARAKLAIEEDYKRGRRYREEDLETQLAADRRLKEEELREALTELNRRGILFGEIDPSALARGETKAPYSDIAQRFTLTPLSERQQAREQAIRRALARQEEVSGVERKRGIEELDIVLPRVKRELEEEKKRRAIAEFVPLARERARARYEEAYYPTIQRYLQSYS